MALRDSTTFNTFATQYANDEQKFLTDLQVIILRLFFLLWVPPHFFFFQYAYQRLLQLGAGQTYGLASSKFQWKGYNGNWSGYGTVIQPLEN